MHLGRKIKVARISRGLTQQELADKINKTRPLVSHIEQTGKVNHYTFIAICKALKITVDEVENIVNEPSINYSSKNNRNDITEIEKLKAEIDLLKELVASQKEIITMLRAKPKRKSSN